MKTKQEGATLIVVLILLVIITVIGTLAIRSSLTALNIATNSQAQQLLVQNSDSAIFNVENPALLVRNTAYDGLFGQVKTDANKGKELVFCYRGVSRSFYDYSKASFMQWVSGTAPSNSELGLDGYCKIDDANFFTSGRRAVMTQVAVKVNTSTDSQSVGLDQAFQHMQQGTDVDSAKIDKSEKILVTATSIVPALSSATDTDINNCFSKHMNQVVIPSGVMPASGMGKSVAECLQGLGVPVNTQITEYNLTQAFNRT
jgi:hypothetical protein